MKNTAPPHLMTLLSEADVRALIDPQLAMEAAEVALHRQAQASMPPPGRLDIMGDQPRFRALVLAGRSARGFALKLNLHTYSDEPEPGHRSASLLTLWDTDNCRPRALIAAAAFNDHRTAASFAVAARALARIDATTLTVFGAGKIAGPAIRYLSLVRPIERIILVSRTKESADRLANLIRTSKGLEGITIQTGLSSAQATREADILVTATTSDVPVFPGEAIRPGTFVILGGANRPHCREADDDLARRAEFYVDDMEACLQKAGDIVIPLGSGALRKEQIVGEIGDVLGICSLSNSTESIRVFKSTGLAMQDLVLAEQLLSKANTLGHGVAFDPVGQCQYVGL